MRPILPVLAAAIWSAFAMTPAAATDHTDLTLYRSDAASLYASSGGNADASGYALVHEQRGVSLAAGAQRLTFDGLPPALDSEALDVSFADAAASVRSRRLLLPDGNGLLATRIGSPVVVYGPSGNTLAEGTLRSTQDGLLVATREGPTLVREYAGVRLSGATHVRAGAALEVQVDARRAGAATARLDYPTGGLGWRAAYGAVLHADSSCRMDFTSLASIANRSGRDWHADRLTLVAGEPNFAKSSGPRPMLAMRAVQAGAAPPLPQQSSLGDYRRYVLPQAVDLPNASVTQVPLYAPQTLDCTRRWVYENGNAWTPNKPIVTRDFGAGDSAISSRLGFTAFDSLPAGYLRVATVVDGNREFIGEARIADTAKGQPVEVEIGTPFDLTAQRTQTAFNLDRAAHALDEAFRITLTNSGDTARTITVREHPTRWRAWTLVSSSQKPARTSHDLLEFAVAVPAHGKTHLDYAVRYQWHAADE